MIPMDGDGLCFLILMTGVVFGLGCCFGVWCCCRSDEKVKPHKTVEKKILPAYMEAVSSGEKRFELRKDEDDIQVGDTLILREWDGNGYTGFTQHRTVRYVLRNVPEYGLQDGYCIIGFYERFMGQIDLWGNEQEEEVSLSYEQKIEQARQVLVMGAEISRDYYDAPLIITYSGGKDSDVMLDIAIDCLEPDEMEVMNSHTTVDAPQTVRHIEKVFKYLNEVGIKTSYKNRYPVEKSMWELIIENKFPPTRYARYCCKALKETSTPNRIIAVGVREDESIKRKNRQFFIKRGWHGDRIVGWTLEHTREVFSDAKNYDEVFDCKMVTLAKNKADLICNPIYKFTEQDVWRYIHENEIEVNPLYRMGYKRVGCILCPLGGRNLMLKAAADFPKYKETYIRTFDRMLDERRKAGKDDVTGREGYLEWNTGKDVYDWWVNGSWGIKGQVNIEEFLQSER